jgi:serine/threonine protein kinase/WD40 repeat protein
MLTKGSEPVPGYRLEQFLGRGQFGEVWRARSPGGAVVALKFLNLSERQGWKEFRAIQEIKSVRHPHLAPITALWLLDDEGHVLSDDLVDRMSDRPSGTRETLVPAVPEQERAVPQLLVVATLLCDKNLLDRLDECREAGRPGIPVDELLRYMEEAAKGIDFLNSPHDVAGAGGGIQHCDIKPANIMLTGNSVMICDFGVARVLADAKSAVTGTSMAGSPAYIAPECIERRPSSASDQYSLAVTYYELRTGSLPFDDQSVLAVMEAHRRGNLNLAALEPAEQQVIRKATSVDPADRYPNAAAMVGALRASLQHAPPAATTTARPVWRRVVALLSVVAVVAAALLAGWYSYPRAGKQREPSTAIPPLQLSVDPPDASVLVGGQVQALVDGRLVVPWPSTGQLHIVVRKPEYVERELRVDAEQQGTDPLRVQLQRDPAFTADAFARRALAILDSERFGPTELSNAVEAYQRAITLDAARYAMAPLPRMLAGEAAGTQGRGFAIHSLGTSPDARWLIARGGEGNRAVMQWDLMDLSRAVRVLHEHGSLVCNVVVTRAMAVSADIQENIKIARWDDRGALQGAIISPERLRGYEMAADRDQRWLVVGDFSGGVWRWNLNDNGAAEPLKLGSHEEGITAVHIATDGRTAFTAAADDRVLKWDLDRPENGGRSVGQLAGDVLTLAGSPDGRWLAFAGEGDDGDGYPVMLVDLQGTAVGRSEVRHTQPVEAVVFDASSQYLASGSGQGDVFVSGLPGSGDPAPPPRFLPGAHSGPLRGLAFGSLPGWIATAGDDGQVCLWNYLGQDPRPLMLAGAAGGILDVAIADRWVIASTRSGAVLAWDLRQCVLIKLSCDQLQIEPRTPADGQRVKT